MNGYKTADLSTILQKNKAYSDGSQTVPYGIYFRSSKSSTRRFVPQCVQNNYMYNIKAPYWGPFVKGINQLPFIKGQ